MHEKFYYHKTRSISLCDNNTRIENQKLLYAAGICPSIDINQSSQYTGAGHLLCLRVQVDHNRSSLKLIYARRGNVFGHLPFASKSKQSNTRQWCKYNTLFVYLETNRRSRVQCPWLPCRVESQVIYTLPG